MPSYLEDDYGTKARSYTEVRRMLIEEVRRYPRIYSEKRLPRELIDRFFPRIARAIGYRREKSEEVYMAWKSLREQFKREWRKVKAGAKTEDDIKWPLYSSMKWLADDAPGTSQAVPRESDEDDGEDEEEQQDDAMVLDGSERNVDDMDDTGRVTHDTGADHASNTVEVDGNVHADSHDNHDANYEANYAQPPSFPVIEQYVVENPVHFEKLPALISGVEQQLEAASCWQVMQGQVLGQRLKELPVGLQRQALDELNAVMARFEQKALAEILPPPATFGSPPSDSGEVDVMNTSDDFTETTLIIDETTN